ncbi:8-oxo-dGTP diphosphatase [Bacillus shivajii]|nr:8-oxo-dGTP diphosphatase [Bacillus shivajii]
MQRVTNCLLTNEDEVLMLKKPSKGWWVAPGGKMEQRESILESVTREFIEETGLKIKEPELRGIFTIIIEEKGNVVDEWMMFTFHAKDHSGKLLEESPEGQLAWQKKDAFLNLPMARGDYEIFDHVLKGEGIMYGNFTYSKSYELLSYRLEVAGLPTKVFDVKENK